MMKQIISAGTIFLFAACASAQQDAIVAGSTLTVNQCISIALSNDPDIKAYDYTAQAQQAVLAQSKSAYYPTLNAEAGFNSNHADKLNALDPMASSIGNYDGKNAGLTLNQLVFDFGKTPAAVSANRANLRSAKFNVDDQIVSVVDEVKRAYNAVVFAKLALALSDEVVVQYRQSLTYAQAHYDSKIRPKYDVTKAEADLSSAQLDNIKARNNVLLAQAYLNNTMNLPEAPEFNVQASTEFVKYKIKFDDIISAAYANKPDLLSLIAQADAQEEQLKYSRRDQYPALNAVAGYNFIGSQSPISQGWNAGLNITADIFTGMRKVSKVDEMDKRLKAMRSKIDSLKLKIYLDAKDAFLNLAQYEQSNAAATDQVRQTTENLEISMLRYQTGLGSPVEISDAMVLYNNSKMELLQSLYQYQLAKAGIEKIMGNKQ